jgi:hypothetical protein
MRGNCVDVNIYGFLYRTIILSLALNLSSIRNSLREKNMAPTKDDIPDDTTAFQPMDCAPSGFSPPMKKPGIGNEMYQSPSPQSCDSTDHMEDSRRSEDSGYFTELSWRNTSSSDRGSLSPLNYSPPSKRVRGTDTDKDDMKLSSLLSKECSVGDTKTSTPFKSSGKDDSEACHVNKDLGKRSERKAMSRKVGTVVIIWSDFSVLLV